MSDDHVTHEVTQSPSARNFGPSCKIDTINALSDIHMVLDFCDFFCILFWAKLILLIKAYMGHSLNQLRFVCFTKFVESTLYKQSSNSFVK